MMFRSDFPSSTKQTFQTKVIYWDLIVFNKHYRLIRSKTQIKSKIIASIKPKILFENFYIYMSKGIYSHLTNKSLSS